MGCASLFAGVVVGAAATTEVEASVEVDGVGTPSDSEGAEASSTLGFW